MQNYSFILHVRFYFSGVNIVVFNIPPAEVLNVLTGIFVDVALSCASEDHPVFDAQVLRIFAWRFPTKNLKNKKRMNNKIYTGSFF